ncbi:tyrosine-type recombinase/integrase [Serratia liquefaciens]|uniref:tyrosine-type recombinase/integrase n=1 Tax=Serratia liquefaciens TaxID=614 RepID=UPI0023625586|nr:tyrosine-type recombinase/integrase [Serratia liquefaciens]
MSNKVSHKLSHTIQRGRTFYTNFRLNDSKKFVRLSLNTDSLKQAQVTMSRMTPYIPLVQSGAMSVDEFKARLNGLKDLTKQDLDTFLFRHLEGDYEEVERLPKLGALTKEYFGGSIDREATKNDASGYARATIDNIHSGSDFGLAAIKHSLRYRGINPEGLPEEMSDVVSQIDMSLAMKYQAYEAFYSDDFLKYRQILGSLKEQVKILSDKKPIQNHTPQQQPSASAIRLSEAWKMYVADKGQKWRRSVASENQRFYEVLLYVVGDISVDGISRQQIREALRVAENLPTRTRKPYSSMSLAECIAYDVPEEDLISSEHVHKHLKIWRSFFKTYLVEREDLLTTSPTKGINYETKPNRGGNYSASEMNSIKRHLENLPDHDWRKYYFLTLIYTGARRGEIADIRKHHIRQDDETSRWYIFIEGGKTDHAKRQIPIHKNLEDGLFGRIAPMAVDDLVFGDLPDYTTITNKWVEIMRELSMPDYTEFGFKRRIHSLRHTFISKALRSIGNSTLVKFAVGHSHKKNLGITDTYNHTPPLIDLLPVVDCQHE